MDAQELRNLQEAYLEVVIGEGKVEWDNPKRHLPSGLTPREKNRAKRISTGVENPNIKPSEKKLERYGKLKIAHDDEKGKKVPRNKRHHFSQFDTGPFVSDPVSKRREQKNKLKDLKELVKEDFDLYDIILSHLLDEGFASTEQSADKIILNMSESWFEEILNERTRFAKETGKNVRTGRPSVEGGDPKVAERNKLPGYKYGGSKQEPKERGKKPPSPSEEAKKKGVLSPLEHKVALRRNARQRASDFRMDTRGT